MTELPEVEGASGGLWGFFTWLPGAIIKALMVNVAKLFALGVAALTAATNQIGSSMLGALEYYFPTRLHSSDLSAYQVAFGYAQAWFDVAFFLQLVVAYWTFVAVLAMTKFTLSLIPGVA